MKKKTYPYPEKKTSESLKHHQLPTLNTYTLNCNYLIYATNKQPIQPRNVLQKKKSCYFFIVYYFWHIYHFEKT